MCAKRICFANQKGGVAKTTTSIITASALTKKGYRVLVVDLDPQCNSTHDMNIADVEIEFTLYEALQGQCSISSCIISTPLGDIAAGSLDLIAAERQFTDIGREVMLRDLVETVEQDYDFILIDTPPNLGWSTINALTAAEWIVIPCEPDLWSNDAITKLDVSVGMVRRFANPDIKYAGILITRLDERTISSRLNMQVSDIASSTLEIPLFKSRIHKATNIRDAFNCKQDFLERYPKCRAANDYRSFTEELLGKVA